MAFQRPSEQHIAPMVLDKLPKITYISGLKVSNNKDWGWGGDNFDILQAGLCIWVIYLKDLFGDHYNTVVRDIWCEVQQLCYV